MTFFDNSIDTAAVTGDQCGNECLNTNGCSHFARTSNPDTCWIKSGVVQQSVAIFNNNFAMICGILPISNSPDTRRILGYILLIY